MLKAESSKTHWDEIEFREAVLKTPKQLIEEEKRAKGNVDLYHWQKNGASKSGRMNRTTS